MIAFRTWCFEDLSWKCSELTKSIPVLLDDAELELFLAGDLWDSNEAVASLHETKRLIVELELVNSQLKFCWYLTARFLNLSETPHDIVVDILSHVDPH